MDDDSIFNESRIDKDVVNIMLFGSDVREGERHGRSDTMMILSYNRKLRDRQNLFLFCATPGFIFLIVIHGTE